MPKPVFPSGDPYSALNLNESNELLGRMRTVVIFTGALRTVKKTMSYFKKNVLLRPDIDIFVCVQNDTKESDESWSNWFRQQLGRSMLSIQWYSHEAYPDWVKHRDRQIGYLTIEDSWKNYLRTSGSMIEYFQLQLAYMAMCQHEQRHGFRYDYLVRARTDSIYAKPLDFHWLHWTEAQVAARMARINEELVESSIDLTPTNQLKYFMCTIMSDDVLPNMERIFADYRPCETETVLDLELTPSRLLSFIKKGRYILTLRRNNLYVVRRSLFYMIPTLGTMYGFLRSPEADPWWFNAEGQFRDACYYSEMSIFDYSTLYEEKSLEYPNRWNEADFFDLQFRLINPMMLYCVVRK